MKKLGIWALVLMLAMGAIGCSAGTADAPGSSDAGTASDAGTSDACLLYTSQNRPEI